MTYKLWQWNGSYIKGKLLSSHKTKTTAEKRARLFPEFDHLLLCSDGWLIINKQGMPDGMIEKVKNGSENGTA